MSAILIVEDNDDLRELFAEILRAEGYTVVEADDGEQAMRVLGELRPLPGLVLLDLMMPRMSGFEVLAEVEARDDLAAIPVAIVSAMPASTVTVRRPLLTKPVGASTLVEFVRKYFPAEPRAAAVA